MITTLESISQFDQKVLESLNSIIGNSWLVDALFRFISEWLVYFIPLALLVAWFSKSKQVNYREMLLAMTTAGVFAWQGISRLIKIFYFRERPAAAGFDVKELFFHRPDESFPSDHTSFLVALTTYAYLLGWKKVGHAMLIVSVLVGSARVVTATHWPSDILGGVLVGMAAAALAWWGRNFLSKYLYRPLLALAKALRLA